MAQKTIDFENDILEPIGSLKEDLAEVKDKKITKFYASNQGETHLTDSDNGKMQDMILYGRSERKIYSGYQLIDTSNPVDGKQKTTNGITFTVQDDGGIKIVGTSTDDAYFSFNFSKNKLKLKDNCSLIISANESFSKRKINFQNDIYVDDAYDITLQQPGSINIAKTFSGSVAIGTSRIVVPRKTTVDVIYYPMIEYGNTAHDFEPYTGGIPSPSPDYPQEIRNVANPVVRVCKSNLYEVKANRIIKYNFKGDAILNDDMSITVIGDVLKQYASVYTDTIFLDKGKYKLLANKYSSEKTIGAKMVVYKSSGTVYITDSSQNKQFTIDEDDTKCNVSISFETTVTYPHAVNETIKFALVCDEITDEIQPYHEQTVQLPYTLNAIPVASDGNVTIDGQQYIADRVVEKDGVFGIERNIREIHTNTKTMNNSEEYPGWKEVEGISDVTYYSGQPTGTSRMLTHISNFTKTTLRQNNIGHNNIVFLISGITGYSQSELIAKAIDVDMYIRLQDAIFEPLPGDIQAKLRTLVTNYPVTNISVNSEQLDGYTVFNYPISLANGWNYVKQQLGDTREYIYDMQTQLSDTEYETAMAYVNSEYAVALAELDNM